MTFFSVEFNSMITGLQRWVSRQILGLYVSPLAIVGCPLYHCNSVMSANDTILSQFQCAPSL